MNRLQNSNLPFINLSKENLFLLCDMLELDEIGALIVAIKEYLYEGKEPNLNTKPLRSAWSQVLMLIDRKADSYFTRKEQMEKINKSKKDKKTELTQASTSSIKDVKTTEFDIPNCQIPNTSDLNPSNGKEVEQPQPTIDNTTEAIKTTIEENFITDEEKYGKTVMDFIDKYEDKVIPALNAITEYYHLKNEDYRTLALGANDLINNCMNEYGLIGEDVKKLELFTWDYQKEMVKDRKNKQFKAV